MKRNASESREFGTQGASPFGSGTQAGNLAKSNTKELNNLWSQLVRLGAFALRSKPKYLGPCMDAAEGLRVVD